MKINIADFDIDALYEALKRARKSKLTLCIATDGGWACELAEAWLPNQLCRITENYSREGLKARIEGEIAALAALQS